MEGNDSGLSSYYHQHHPHSPTIATTSNTNGLFTSNSAHYSSEVPPLVFPHSVPGRAPVAEGVKRKRGRPRKYGPGSVSEAPPASANSSGKKTAAAGSPSLPLSSSSSPASPPKAKKESSFSSKKSQLDALGNAGQGFTPHVITVAAGEDVAQKIMSFMQQRKRAVCILSASGSISNASLRQPATLGGNVTYEGRFEILSLSGSYLHTEMEGASWRTGGLSVCLSGADGRIVGGGVGGPLKAAGPVQVIAGSFVIDMNKESSSVVKPEPSGQVIGAMVSPLSFRSTPDSSARISARGNDDHHNIGGSGFIVQSRAMHVMHRNNADVELPERKDVHCGAFQSPEDGDD